MRKQKKICTVEGCGKPFGAKGLCWSHYGRMRNHGDPLGGGPSRATVREPMRFYREVCLTYEGDQCLIWPYGKDRKGYGQLRVVNRKRTVSNLLCTDVYGEPPTPKHEAAHSCGNGTGGCVNKMHLSWKTRAENQADRIIHGTHQFGSNNHCAKLTEAQVLQIVGLEGKEKKEEIAAKFGVSANHVSSIHRGEAWGWFTGRGTTANKGQHP